MKKMIIIIILIGVVSAVSFMSFQTGKSTDETVNEVADTATNKSTDESKGSMSILLLGIDTGALGRVEKGRSDVMMVVTLNPNTKRVTITSIPRDTYTEIIGKGSLDKINHAYAFGGTQMAVETVNNLLEIELDHYVAVNMGVLEQIVDIIGEVEVVPPTTFTSGRYTFNEGEPTLVDGTKALAYLRERYRSGGDYSRQARQRELIQEISKKMLNANSLIHSPQLLSALKQNVETDLNILDLMRLFTTYKKEISTVESYQLSGEGKIIDGIYYDFPDEEVLRDTRQRLNKELN